MSQDFFYRLPKAPGQWVPSGHLVQVLGSSVRGLARGLFFLDKGREVVSKNVKFTIG